jgi:hypothetical protein
MPLLGTAAMLLSFDVDADAIDEHDRWHTHEHLPERLAIPGFRRGTRWTAIEGEPRYMVLYEVDGLATLSSAPYLARLNAPTPWTARMMPHYRGMRRGLCTVAGSFGSGQGGVAALIRFSPGPANAGALRAWLLDEALPPVPGMSGLGSAHLLQGAVAAAMTNEQRIRGADGAIDFATIVTGYEATSVAACARSLADALSVRGAEGVRVATFRSGYSLTSDELAR